MDNFVDRPSGLPRPSQARERGQLSHDSMYIYPFLNKGWSIFPQFLTTTMDHEKAFKVESGKLEESDTQLVHGQVVQTNPK